MSHVTRILNQIDQGDENAAEKLLPLVYAELRNLASAKLSKQSPGQSIQPTMLEHEAYAGRTVHYLNGKVLHEESIKEELLVKNTRIGAASIGNWSIVTRPDSEFAIRNLNGSIDGFAIFAASLTTDEIKEMYENGKP